MSRSDCGGQRRQRPKGDDVIVIDSDDDQDDHGAFVEGKHRKPAAASSKSKTKAAASSPIDLLESDDSDEENHENHSSSLRRPKKRLKTSSSSSSSSSSSLSSAEVADREFAERLQQEEENREFAERLQREENLAATAAISAQRNYWSGETYSSLPTNGLSSNVSANTQKRKEEQKLKSEQDREYEQALLADQIKDIGRREAKEKERREEQEKEQSNQMEKAKEVSVVEDAKEWIHRAGDEPPIGEKGVTRLRFALPSGKKIDRRFYSADTIKTIRAFIIVHFDEKGIDIKSIGFSTNFPKRSFGEAEDDLTLEEAGLAPQALVMVFDLNS